MKIALPFLSTLLAVHAIAIPSKRQSTEYVVDGSFEDVPENDEFKQNIKTGGWTLKNSAEVFDNSPFTSVFQTPYGKKFLSIEQHRNRGSRGSISQPLAGLTAGDSYRLSYAYQPYDNFDTCTVSAMFGSQVIDSFTLPPQDGITDHYISRSKSFTPTQASGSLTFTVLCPKTSKTSGFSVNLDNISLTGP